MEELFRQLDALNLPMTDYAITGSGPLYAHGLIPSLENDLDIIARKEGVEREADNLSGLMYACPEWDPDKKDIDSYLDANGLS